MKKNKNIILAVLLITLFSLNIQGCGKNAGSDELNTAKTVHISTPSNYIPIIVAKEKGFFAKEFGEDVEIVYDVADSGSMIMEMMTSGEIDFAALGDMPVIQAKANGLDVKVLSVFFTSTTGYQLIAAKDSGIQSIEDIKGKNVAVMSGSTNHKLLLKYLNSVNLTEEDINLVFLKNKDQLAAFVGNNVDAAVTQVPTSTTIMEKTGAYEIANAEGYDNIATVMVGRGEFLDKNPEYAKKYLRAVIEATEWTKNNLEEALEIAAEYSEQSVESMKLYYDTRTFEYSLDENNRKGLEDTINYLFEQKTISKKIAVNEIVDDSYIKAVKNG